MTDPKPRRSKGYYMKYKGATPAKGWGGEDAVDYGTAAAPRVGGKAQAKTGGLSKIASRKQLKAARRLRRKMGTGSMASSQAKRTFKRAY
jgi:hypothetical protein